MTSASLFASRMRLPARAAASVERRPAAPTIAATTVSTLGQARGFDEPRLARQHARGQARRAASARSSSRAASRIEQHRDVRPMRAAELGELFPLRCAVSAATAKRSGCRAMTSSVESPIEPVAPSSADACASAHRRKASAQQRRRRHRREQRVDAIEHAAVSGQQRAAVLHAGLPLQQRFAQIAHDRKRRERERARDPERSPTRRHRAREARRRPRAGRAQARRRRRPRDRRRRLPRSCPGSLAARACAGRTRGPVKYAAVSAIQTMAIAASTSHGERACSCTIATHAPISTIQPAIASGSGDAASSGQRATAARRAARTASRRRRRQGRCRAATPRRSRRTARAGDCAPIRSVPATKIHQVSPAKSGEVRPFGRRDDDQRERHRAPRPRRQQEHRRQHERDQHDRGQDARREHRVQEVRGRAQRRQASCAACTCSLVRPKRRSRCRYQSIAALSAIASKSGHSMSVK